MNSGKYLYKIPASKKLSVSKKVNVRNYYIYYLYIEAFIEIYKK